jgi:hypothetical protein
VDLEAWHYGLRVAFAFLGLAALTNAILFAVAVTIGGWLFKLSRPGKKELQS